MSALVHLDADQAAAFDQICGFIASPDRKTFVVGGYAGTGKTTLIRHVTAHVGDALPAVCAYTGKAAYVLRQKGVNAGTMHSLIYTPTKLCVTCGRPRAQCPAACAGTPTRRGFAKVPLLGVPLVIVDEASMVGRQLKEDLESYGVKVLYVGDHGQLEPIGDNPHVMADPDVRLETIHRQAASSPILKFAHHVREGNPPEDFGDDARLRVGVPPDLLEYDTILCGFNETRVAVNNKIRTKRGYTGNLPNVGERVICLRNSREYGIFNGMQATVTWVGRDAIGHHVMNVVDDVGAEYESLPFVPRQFGRPQTFKEVEREFTLWDFGYCLTCHKSQGSAFDRVCVLEQMSHNWSFSRWRYTAATRAAKHLTWCMSPSKRQRAAA